MEALKTFLFSPWGMLICAALFILIFRFIYAITSSFGIVRQICMIAGIVIFCYFGFRNAKINPNADMRPFIGTDWWKSAGIIWLGASLFYMFLFADCAWEKHYYDEYRYSFVKHFLGAPELQVVKEVKEETHPFRWVLFSVFLGFGTMGLCEFLRSIITNNFFAEGYSGCGVFGLIFLVIYVLRIILKIVKTVKDR